MTGVIALAGSYGKSPPSAQITSRTIYDSGLSASAAYQIVNDGTVRNYTNGIIENWLQGYGGTASAYEVRATLNAGTLSSSSGTGTWLNCGTSRFWLLSNSSRNNSTKTAIIFVEIRLASTQVIQDSATITLNAESLGSGDRGTQ